MPVPKKEEKKNQRRWERDSKEKPWTDDQRKEFNERAEMIAPYVKHLTTPPVKEEPEQPANPWDNFFGIGKKPKKEVTQ